MPLEPITIECRQWRVTMVNEAGIPVAAGIRIDAANHIEAQGIADSMLKDEQANGLTEAVKARIDEIVADSTLRDPFHSMTWQEKRGDAVFYSDMQRDVECDNSEECEEEEDE